MSEESPSAKSLEDRLNADAPERDLVLLATTRRWLRAALEEVITPEGFRLVQAEDAGELVRKASRTPPAVVIVDEELPGLDLDSTARALTGGPLGGDSPLLLYTASSVARGEATAEAYRAGFWDVLSDPLRPSVFVAKLRRLLAISGRARRADAPPSSAPGPEASTVGFLTLDELGRVLPAIGALAEREETSVSIVLLSPTGSEEDRDERGLRESAAADLCGPNLRRADLCAWIDDAEIAIVAFDTDAEEARSLVERLDAAASRRTGPKGVDRHLSAAIVELEPSGELERAVRRAGRRGENEETSLEQIVELFHLKDARDALRDAREAGGGVRVVKGV